MADTIRFGIIGCGVIGKVHADQLVGVQGAKLVAVADVNPERAQAVANKYGVDWHSNYEEMLQRADIDVVNVCTPSGLHADMGITAAKAGKHVIVEKPMDISLAKADELIRTCRQNDVKLAVIFQRRWDKTTRITKELIESGKLGNLVLGEAALNWYRSQEYYNSADWRGTWAMDGGGAFMNQAIHTVDQLQYLMGPVSSVFAFSGTLAHEGIEVEDTSSATLRFRSGAIGSLVATTVAYPGITSRIELCGTKGTAMMDTDRDVFTHLYFRPENGGGQHYGDEKAVNLASTFGIGEGDGGASDPTDVGGAGHRAQFIDMIQAIQEDREPKVNGEEGRQALEIILAIYESSRTGKQVQLPL